MSNDRLKRIKVENRDNVAIVTFIDKRIEEASDIQRIGEDLAALVNEHGQKNIILDFGTVEYMSSAVLNKFIKLWKLVTAAYGKLVLCEIDDKGPNRVYSTFVVTRLSGNTIFAGCFPKHADGPEKGLEQAMALFEK